MTTLLSLALSPTHRLVLHEETDNQQVSHDELNQKLRSLFAKDDYRGLLRLGGTYFKVALPPSISFWQRFARLFMLQLCHQVSQLDDADAIAITLPNDASLETLLNQAPFMQGSEYLNKEALMTIWQGLQQALQVELQDVAGDLQAYLNQFHANWNLLGRIYFHLAENKQNAERPFAFLATYSHQLSPTGEVQHLPLHKALQDYVHNKSALLALLIPLQKAAEANEFIKQLVESQTIYRPLGWTATEAYHFLQAVPDCEAAGVLVRIPNWWKPEQPPRPRVKVSLGKNNTSVLGLDAVLDFNFTLALDNGESLTQEEIKSVLASKTHLVKVKGQWVEVDPGKLQDVLLHWKKIQQHAQKEGLTLAESLRLLASGGTAETAEAIGLPSAVADWSTVVAGDWLANTLAQLRSPALEPEKKLSAILQQYLKATLRPYQWQGVQWLWLLYHLKLGGCLADDMGLGKTIQVIALFLLIKHHDPQSPAKKPHLLIVPSSLLPNWQAEVARFAPDLECYIAHSCAQPAERLQAISPAQLTTVDVVITTYAFVYRLPWLAGFTWECMVVDEAQGIKNPGAKQSLTIKALQSRVRFALTGTPIENRLGDLWSLFDFTSPGLLGSAKTFKRYQNTITQQDSGEQRFYSTLRQLVQPYILRRLKSDKNIIADLPDKVEVHSFCNLSKQQVTLYQQALRELMEQLQTLPVAEAIHRKGVILAYLLRFKQICNHPAQWLGYDNYEAHESGKFLRLIELCEIIADKQEKVLVFTQFTEIMPALMECLTRVFRQEGLMLHGQTPIKARQKMVNAFQTETGPPFFILSLKAGGTGLTLTQASHVIHFDRWWNPAVENQATDRAYRIGQKKNVMVHKFVCQGTIEEKIDALIASKNNLSQEILAAKTEEEVNITMLSNEALLDMVSLDIKRAFTEAL